MAATGAHRCTNTQEMSVYCCIPCRDLLVASFFNRIQRLDPDEHPVSAAFRSWMLEGILLLEAATRFFRVLRPCVGVCVGICNSMMADSTFSNRFHHRQYGHINHTNGEAGTRLSPSLLISRSSIDSIQSMTLLYIPTDPLALTLVEWALASQASSNGKCKQSENSSASAQISRPNSWHSALRWKRRGIQRTLIDLIESLSFPTADLQLTLLWSEAP